MLGKCTSLKEQWKVCHCADMLPGRVVEFEGLGPGCALGCLCWIGPDVSQQPHKLQWSEPPRHVCFQIGPRFLSTQRVICSL